jgi:light-regulated signal transduction histidine kinase (bacteriophytochrome)
MPDVLIGTVANCDQEPIHALGSIQSHGALLCFDATGILLAKSATAQRWLGPLPALGERLAPHHLDPIGRRTIEIALAEPTREVESIECDGASGSGQRFDLVVHWSGHTLIAEWEQVAPDAPSPGYYATLAQRAIQHLQQVEHADVASLLQDTVEAVRAMTGFDRVMGYRFLQDDSGQVVAESKHDDLVPFLHQRYPAGDIPAQARRLYILHPIRQIVSVDSAPVPIEPALHPRSGQPYDLSHSILRSVSPIHIEYLKNMGVAASMSISIVINGRLWGLIACHHMANYRAPLAVRLSCTVLTQVLSILVERVEFKRRVVQDLRVATLGREITSIIRDAPDFAAGVMSASPSLRQLIDCDDIAILIDQRVLPLGRRSIENAPGIANDVQSLRILSEHMTDAHLDLLTATSIAAELPFLPPIRTNQGEAAGLVAIQLVGEVRVTVIWLRDELVETICWAGPPDKIVAQGPNGPRLTPRGSFEVWKQTVRGSCREWSAFDSDAVRSAKALFQEVALDRMRESDRERMTLLATLGHDLRDPLQAINLAMQLMGKGLANSTDTAKRVEGSTRRMQSLISYILDVSRIRSGIGLGLVCAPVSLDGLLETVVEEVRFAFPGREIVLDTEKLGLADLDEDRFVQGLSNLLSNARQHGVRDEPIVLAGRNIDGERRISVKNRTTKRLTVPFRRLIDPFKGGALNVDNPSGLGLGLFIANAIFVGHGAAFSAKFDEHEVSFTIALP